MRTGGNRIAAPMKRILGLDPVDIEVELLLEAIYRRWGNDFRDYSLSASKRRICRFVEVEKLSSISELQGKVLRDPPLSGAPPSGIDH